MSLKCQQNAHMDMPISAVLARGWGIQIDVLIT